MTQRLVSFFFVTAPLCVALLVGCSHEQDANEEGGGDGPGNTNTNTPSNTTAAGALAASKLPPKKVDTLYNFIHELHLTYCASIYACCTSDAAGFQAPDGATDQDSCVASLDRNIKTLFGTIQGNIDQGLVKFDTTMAARCIEKRRASQLACFEAIEDLPPPTECSHAWVGTLPEGSFCHREDGVCGEGLFCDAIPPETGRCVRAGVRGEACNTTTELCDKGLVCNLDGHCDAPAPVGAACVSDGQCTSLSCIEGMCKSQLVIERTCQ